MNDDAQLLIRFANDDDEAAFSELVRRHLNLVYSVALRLLGGDAHLAQDVTQTVFTDLARKAKSLPRGTVLAGWIHEATRFAAANAVRTERRRQAREQEALTMHDPAPESTPEWDQLRPVLDSAIGELSASDRDAVLLRFFERKDLNAVGAALGVSEDAAQKRVARALDKLRTILTQRGVNLSATALAAAISGGAVQTAPAGIGAIVTTTALASAAAVPIVIQAAFNTMNWINLKAVAAVVAAAVVAGTGTYFVQQREVVRLNSEHRDLLAQQEKLRADQSEASAAAQARETEIDLLRKDASEVVRLRGQVAQLRRQVAEAANKRPAAVAETPPAAAAEPSAPPVETYTATAHAVVPWKQTLITGGWAISPGKRTLVFIQPEEESGSVMLQTRIIELPEPVLTQLGLDGLKADNKQSSASALLNVEQTEAVIKALEKMEGVDVLSAPKVLTVDGRQAQVKIVADVKTAPSGEQYELGPSIDLVPQISADRASVHLDVTARLRLPSTPTK